MVEPDKLETTIWSMRYACWIPNATNRHLEYVKFIAFPLEQWLQERALLLRYRHIVCLVRKPFRNLHLYPSVLYFEEKSRTLIRSPTSGLNLGLQNGQRLSVTCSYHNTYYLYRAILHCIWAIWKSDRPTRDANKLLAVKALFLSELLYYTERLKN